MELTQVAILSIDMLHKHDELRSWKFIFNRRKSCFGVCNYSNKNIELSSILIPQMTDKAIIDTIIHEIAHALTPGHGHDRVWRRKCIELGGNGERCGSSDKFKNGEDGKSDFQKNNSKYTLTCPVCGHESHKNRIPTRNSSCGKHGGRYYNPMYKLVLSKNY